MFPGLKKKTVLNHFIILTLAGQSKCYSHNPERKAEKNTTTSFKDFVLSRPGVEPTTFRLRGGRSNQWATEVVDDDDVDGGYDGGDDDDDDKGDGCGSVMMKIMMMMMMINNSRITNVHFID